jgi:hypothetical protein
LEVRLSELKKINKNIKMKENTNDGSRHFILAALKRSTAQPIVMEPDLN